MRPDLHHMVAASVGTKTHRWETIDSATGYSRTVGCMFGLRNDIMSY